MDEQELMEKASRAGNDYGWRTPKPAIIRAIQRQQGDSPCFGTDERYTCSNFRCTWRVNCLKPIAKWLR